MHESQTAPATCARCGGLGTYGEILVGRDSRSEGRHWFGIRPPEQYGVCDRCARWSCATLDAGRTQAVPGASAAVSFDPGRCDFCDASLRNESYTLDILPAARERHRLVAMLRHFRVCLACVAWFRTRLYEDPDGAPITAEQWQWPATRWRALCSMILGSADELQLEGLGPDTGTRWHRLRPMARSVFTADPTATLFLGATTDGHAAQFVRTLTPEQRRRTAVVARFDALEDMEECISLGVGDFLASPLGSRQAAGSLVRLDALQSDSGRGPGLAVLPEPGPGLPGRPAQRFSFVEPASGNRTVLVWLLRRFLRGYDTIGLDADGRLAAHVFCPAEHVRDVLARLTLVLNGVARVCFSGPGGEQAAA